MTVKLVRCSQMKCNSRYRKTCLTSTMERDNTWPRKIIGRLLMARGDRHIMQTLGAQAEGHCIHARFDRYFLSGKSQPPHQMVIPFKRCSPLFGASRWMDFLSNFRFFWSQLLPEPW